MMVKLYVQARIKWVGTSSYIPSEMYEEEHAIPLHNSEAKSSRSRSNNWWAAVLTIHPPYMMTETKR